MTTNSPNPVDGDIQALIEHIKQTLSVDDGAIGFQVYKIALAALTAEPIGFIHNYVNPGDTKSTSAISKEENRHYGRPVYLNPPAQLLRPVELPEPYDDGHGNLWLPQDAVISAIKKAGQVEAVSNFPGNLADNHEVAKLRDRSFVDGLKSGFSMGQMQDETRFKETVERYLNGMREVKND